MLADRDSPARRALGSWTRAGCAGTPMRRWRSLSRRLRTRRGTDQWLSSKTLVPALRMTQDMPVIIVPGAAVTDRLAAYQRGTSRPPHLSLGAHVAAAIRQSVSRLHYHHSGWGFPDRCRPTGRSAS